MTFDMYDIWYETFFLKHFIINVTMMWIKSFNVYLLNILGE